MSEGIPANDWDRVRRLETEAQDAIKQDDLIKCQAKTEELLSLLRHLNVRYGDLPAIVDRHRWEEEFLSLLPLHNEWRAFFEQQEARTTDEVMVGEGCISKWPRQ
jgi:hypothetical protein